MFARPGREPSQTHADCESDKLQQVTGELQGNTWSEPAAINPHHHRKGSEQRRKGPPPHKAALLIKGCSSPVPEPAYETPESHERQNIGQKCDEHFQWQRSPNDSRRRCPQAADNGDLQCRVELSAGRAGVLPKTQMRHAGKDGPAGSHC